MVTGRGHRGQGMLVYSSACWLHRSVQFAEIIWAVHLQCKCFSVFTLHFNMFYVFLITEGNVYGVMLSRRKKKEMSVPPLHKPSQAWQNVPLWKKYTFFIWPIMWKFGNGRHWLEVYLILLFCMKNPCRARSAISRVLRELSTQHGAWQMVTDQ